MTSYRYVLLALAPLFWSLNFVIGKILSGVVPPNTVNFLRWILPFLVYMVLYRREVIGDFRHILSHWRLLLFLSFTGYCINGVTAYKAVHYTTAINASLLASFNPVVFVLVAYIIYGEKINKTQVIGIMISLIGVLWIVFRGEMGRLIELAFNVGDILMFVCVISWALYSVVYKRKANEFEVGFLFTVLIIGAIVLNLPLAIGENIMFGMEWIEKINAKHIWGIVALNIFPTLLAFNCWNRAITMVTSSEAAIFMNLIPVFTMIISVTFLGEKLLLSSVIGGICIFCGIILVTNSKIVTKYYDGKNLIN